MAAAASSRRAPRRPRDEPDDARPVRRSKRERKPAHSGMPEPCSAEEERLLRIAVEVSRRDQVRCVYSRVPPPFPALAARCPARGRRWAGNRTGPALRGTKASGAAAPGRSAEPTIGWNKKKARRVARWHDVSARRWRAPAYCRSGRQHLCGRTARENRHGRGKAQRPARRPARGALGLLRAADVRPRSIQPARPEAACGRRSGGCVSARLPATRDGCPRGMEAGAGPGALACRSRPGHLTGP